MFNEWRVQDDQHTWLHPHLGRIVMEEVPLNGGGTVIKFDWYDKRGDLRNRFSTLHDAKLAARRITRPTQHPEYR